MQIPFEALLPAEVRRMVAPDSNMAVPDLNRDVYGSKLPEADGAPLGERSTSQALSEEAAPPLGGVHIALVTFCRQQFLLLIPVWKNYQATCAWAVLQRLVHGKFLDQFFFVRSLQLSVIHRHAPVHTAKCVAKRVSCFAEQDMDRPGLMSRRAEQYSCTIGKFKMISKLVMLFHNLKAWQLVTICIVTSCK